MLETIMKLYVMYMAGDVRSPLPHLFGPPGCGKSTVVAELADLVGVHLHTINVSRISPLELEGVQMPHSVSPDEMILRMLPATFWTQLEAGDILLLDEFLRGFPEVYNGMLDILTSRQVGGYVLPQVFIIAASNSTVSYDKALEDRLMHIAVPDPRKLKSAKRHLAKLMVDQLGLMPEMIDSYEMQTLLDTEVLPMYEVLDSLKNKTASPAMLKGCSVRNLIGQAKLRHVQSSALSELLSMNNTRAIQSGKIQYVLLLSGKKVDPSYVSKATVLQGNPKLTEIQALNLGLNLQLVEMEAIRNQRESEDTDDSGFNVNDV